MPKGEHLQSHKVNGCNSQIEIRVKDDPGVGNASHVYTLYCPNDDFNEELNASWMQEIHFQKGAIGEAGVNGVTHEALLAIIEHRLDRKSVV